MNIAPRKEFEASKAETFIKGAAKSTGVDKGNQKQITVAMPPELLERLEAAAKSKGIGRVALLRMALIDYLEKD